jgi:GTP diphosphokinase / guanosine-3',5'-bis(diphosphate) 3'-diphosphatase
VAKSANPALSSKRLPTLKKNPSQRMQRRKDPDASPYINHPIALANVLANEGAVEDVVVLAAAVLHDTIEDTETTAPELLAAFGAEIVGVVVEVTDDKTLSKQTWKLAQIDHAADLSHRAKLVKLADKICNVRDVASSPPADWPLERRQDAHPERSRCLNAGSLRRQLRCGVVIGSGLGGYVVDFAFRPGAGGGI